MKLFHLSDLHIGRQLQMYSLVEAQKNVFDQILRAITDEKPDAVLIAGDVYDKSVPSSEAFDLLNELLVQLSEIEPAVPVLIISGNHDNNLRLNYASHFMEKNKIFIAANPPQKKDEHLKKVTLQDEYGEVNIYLLPFTRPADVRNLYGDEREIRDFNDAVAALIERENIDYSERNILVSHQFYVADGKEPERRDSEMRYISVGGLDSVDISHVEKFDYVALGHIHSAQKVGMEHIRYCGTPIKYSVSEAGDNKSITIVELGEKNTEPVISYLSLAMKPDVVKLRGTLQEVIDMADAELKKSYVHITLTDEECGFRPKDSLMEYFDNIVEVVIDNRRTRAELSNDMEATENISPETAFVNFYQEMNGQPMSDAEKKLLMDVISTIKKKKKEDSI